MSFESGPLVFRSDPASLQQLSAVRVAALLWQRETTELLANNADTISTSLKKALPTVNLIAEVPSSIESLIDKYLLRMKKSIAQWVKYTYQRIFSPHQKSKHEILKYLDLVRWLPNGNLDYELTAKNLIAKSELSIEFKYRLACCYCFEDDVRRMWPKVQRYACTEREDNYMYAVFYWDKRMTNQVIDPNHFQWIEATVDNWAQVHYFWSLLKAKNKVEGACKIIALLGQSNNYSSRLLPLLTGTQQRKVLKRCLVYVICDLIATLETAEFALQTWRYVRKMATTRHFIGIFDEIRMTSVRYYIHLSVYLYELWLNTSERLKNDVLENATCREKILNTVSICGFYAENLSREVRLLLEFLRHTGSQYRYEYWLENNVNLFVGVNSSRLNELMQLCLGSDEKVADFKEAYFSKYDNIEFYCTSMVAEGYFDEINEFLNFCSSDRTAVTDLKRKIIWSKGLIIYCVRYCDKAGKMRKFEEFISDVYPDENCRKNLKCQMVISPTVLAYLREAITWGVLCPVKNFVQLFLTQEDDLQIVKNCFRQLCRLILIEAKFSKFHVEEWNEFLLWCLNDDENRFIRFKRTIPIDDVFDDVFEIIVDKLCGKLPGRCVGCGNNTVSEKESFDEWDFQGDYAGEKPMDDFERINVLLLWYFSSKSKVDLFKKKKSPKYTGPCYTDSDTVNALIKSFFKTDN